LAENHLNRVITRYQITALTWNRPQQLLLQTGSGKQACFPATVTCLIKVILEESQRNITSCLLEISVPFSRIAEESPTTSGTNP